MQRGSIFGLYAVKSLWERWGKVENRAIHLLGLIQLVEQLRRLDLEMQLQTVLTFLLIAKEEGCTLRDLEREMGVSSSSVSRNVAALSATDRRGAAGHGLVMKEVSPTDGRARVLFLTRKGRKFLVSLLRPLDMQITR